MARKIEMMEIAFSHGGRLPVGLIGNPAEVEVMAHEAVSVPRSYGEYMIADRFAYAPTPPAGRKTPKPAPSGGQDGDRSRIAAETATTGDLLAASAAG